MKKGRLPGFVRMRIILRDTIGPWFDYVFVSKKEMKDMLKGTGWEVKKFYSGFAPGYAAILGKAGRR